MWNGSVAMGTLNEAASVCRNFKFTEVYGWSHGHDSARACTFHRPHCLLRAYPCEAGDCAGCLSARLK